MANLTAAQKIASSVRLSEDRGELEQTLLNPREREEHRDTMLRHGVLLSKAVTPLLEERLSSVCVALGIPRNSVTAFVYNSAEVQADCLIDTPESCVLRFTSGLVNLMDEKEFQFIAGHELGHFLLGHGACSQDLMGRTPEEYMVRRARELSADRIGFLATENLEESIQAIIKTASGLGEEFLRFDVSSFLSQTDMLSDPAKGESLNSTHPSMLIRCRALLWFSMSIQTLAEIHQENEHKIKEVNSRVLKDLEKFVDGQLRLKKIELENTIALWKSALLIFDAGAFTREIQLRLAEALSDETLHSIKAFFELYKRDALKGEISRRLDASIALIRREFPTSAKEIETRAFEKAYKIVEGGQ